jgi:hypothetical protein
MFHFAHHLTETFVDFQPIEVSDTVTTGQIQQNQSHDDLMVTPPLSLVTADRQMPTDGITQPRGLRQIKVSRQSGKGGQACNTILILVLEWKNALCHNCFTSLVIDFLVAQAFYLPGFAGINEVLYFLAGGSG